jgi:hypothetical protein
MVEDDFGFHIFSNFYDWDEVSAKEPFLTNSFRWLDAFPMMIAPEFL